MDIFAPYVTLIAGALGGAATSFFSKHDKG
jgi:hypothetical protein